MHAVSQAPRDSGTHGVDRRLRSPPRAASLRPGQPAQAGGGTPPEERYERRGRPERGATENGPGPDEPLLRGQGPEGDGPDPAGPDGDQPRWPARSDDAAEARRDARRRGRPLRYAHGLQR